MSGRRPPRRSPWFGEGNTFAAAGLAGAGRSAMTLAQPAFGRDPRPGGVDRGEALGRDADGFRGEAAGDLAIGVVLGDEAPVMASKALVARCAVGADYE